MGAEGIAVGMATKIPPHNLGEVANAIIATIEKGRLISQDNGKTENSTDNFFIKKIELQAQESSTKREEIKPPSVEFESDISTEELTNFIKGPDFPTGGAIYDAESLQELYGTGRGKILVRGIASIEEDSKGRSRIVITEIPYQVNKASLVSRIAELYHEKKIIGISDLRDESDQKGMSIVIELKKDARPKAVLNNLYKHTQLQINIPANFVVLVDGTPKTLTLKQILIEYVRHRQKVITKRSIFELREAKRRSHILEGLKIALDNLDAVIKTIKESKTQEDAKQNLMKKFALTEIQAIAILDMQLRRLAALEREKIEKEFEEIKKIIDKLTIILKEPQRVLEIIKEELTELKEKYSDARKTRVYKQKIGEFNEEDLIAKEDILITVTKTGYIKRVPRAIYRTQRRGGKGVTGMATKEEDEIKLFVAATTHDTILFFTDKGKVYGTKAWEIQETSRQSKGQALVNILNLEQGEQIRSILPTNERKAANLIMSTAKGTVKKTSFDQFKNLRSSGLIAIKLEQGDSLVSVKQTTGSDHILLLTKMGKAIRFPEENVRPLGRATTGVRGIRIEKNDEVIDMEVFPRKEDIPADKRKKVFRDILTISENGIGKRTAIHLFPVQKRGGKGIKAAIVNQKTGQLASSIMVDEKIEQVAITSKFGQVIKLPLKNIPQLGRLTQGVILMRFAKKDDRVAAVTCLEKEEAFEGKD